MIREWNILILENKLKDDSLSPLIKYFIWEKLNELKKIGKMVLKEKYK